jgi:hypothetical protein
LWYQLNQDREQGFLGYVQSAFSVFRKLKVTTRYQYFETASYSSRMYAYEPDVLSGFSIPAFSGMGSRFLLILGYPVSKKLNIWCRWARLASYPQQVIAEPVLQFHDNEIKVQAQLIF